MDGVSYRFLEKKKLQKENFSEKERYLLFGIAPLASPPGLASASFKGARDRSPRERARISARAPILKGQEIGKLELSCAPEHGNHGRIRASHRDRIHPEERRYRSFAPPDHLSYSYHRAACFLWRPG